MSNRDKSIIGKSLECGGNPLVSTEVQDIVTLIQAAGTYVDGLQQAVLSVNTVASTVGTAVVKVREIELEINRLDGQLRRFIVEQDTKLSEFKAKSQLVGEQLQALSGRLDKMLDAALAIDIGSAGVHEMELRNRLLNDVNKWSDTISTLLMTLMGA